MVNKGLIKAIESIINRHAEDKDELAEYTRKKIEEIKNSGEQEVRLSK